MQLRPLLPRLGSALRHRPRLALALTLCAPLAGAAAAPAGGDVTATIWGLRSAKGEVLACLTAQPAAFPDCASDPQARRLTVSASSDTVLNFGPVPEGVYAISLIHDENGNGRLDKRLLLPSEGFGFSRDAPLRFGPPTFARASFAVVGEDLRLRIRMRYLF